MIHYCVQNNKKNFMSEVDVQVSLFIYYIYIIRLIKFLLKLSDILYYYSIGNINIINTRLFSFISKYHCV